MKVFGLFLLWAIAAKVGSESDESRYVQTYCYLAKKTIYYRKYKLDKECLLNVEVFKDQVIYFLFHCIFESRIVTALS